MIKSRYLEAFAELEKSGTTELIGDLLVIEKLPEPEARKVGALFVSDSSHARSSFSAENRPHLALVVATGEGYYDEAGSSKTNARPGDVVLVSPASVRYFTSFGDLLNYEPDTLGITRDGEVQMRFKGQEAYEKAIDILNSYAKVKD